MLQKEKYNRSITMQVRNFGQCTQWLFLLIVFITSIVQITAKDYYQILGVKRNVSEREIKRQFHKLALKYHPDKNKDPDAATRFQTMTEAYDVLSDSNKRQLYDSQGHESFQSYRKHGENDYSKFVFDTDKILKEFDESISQIKHQFQKMYSETYEQIREQTQNIDALFKNYPEMNGQFDLNNLIKEGLNNLKVNFFKKNNQQHCKMSMDEQCI
ncbi:hypothetical protein I4U23_023521 [Adineta vaga]|nr:hypothetical protein I4U23_023521 [Adineta vaga]